MAAPPTVPPPSPNQLSNLLLSSLSSDYPTRHSAEAELQKLRTEAGDGLPVAILGLVVSNDADPAARQSAAVMFKNGIKGWWGSEDTSSTAVYPQISEETRETIKSQLVGLMISLGSFPRLQTQIAEAVARIAEEDFPIKWQGLIDQLITSLSPTDFTTNNAILSAAHSIFSRWRSQFRTDSLFTEIKFVLDKFCKSYLEIFQRVDALLSDSTTPTSQIPTLTNSLILLLQIYYDLNCQDLPEFFEDNLDTFMVILDKYLKWSHPSVVQDPDESLPSPLSQVRSAICEIVELYSHRYAEVFSHLLGFVESVLHLLTEGVTGSVGEDVLVVKAIKFLSTVVKMPSQRDSLGSEATLEIFCQKIVLPNMTLREFEEEMFEDDPQEYVRRDLESGNMENETRRQAASDFTKALMEQFERQITTIITKYINAYLEQYRANPRENWKSKDAAVFLLTSIASRSSTAQHGVTSTNALVDIVQFFTEHVQSDLQGDSHLIVKAAAIKYLYTFRNQLTKEQLSAVIPMLLPHLKSSNFVVHTYAATTIDRVLSIKRNGQSLFTQADIRPYTRDILEAIFGVIEEAGTPERIASNDHLMRCAMRVILVSRQDIMPIHTPIIQRLVNILNQISKNPSNPKFSHYTFESVAAVIRFTAGPNSQEVTEFETALLGENAPFQYILHQEVWEFAPFVFQIVCQLLELHTVSLPPFYQGLLPPVLQKTLWEQRGNIPALVRLLKTFLKRPGQAQSMVENNQLESVLGIFKSLIASKANDQWGMELLEGALEMVPTPSIQPYLQTVFTLLLTRLTGSKTEKFTQRFIRFLAIGFALQKPDHGPDVIVTAIDGCQPGGGLFAQMFQHAILPEIQKTPVKDRKVVAVGLVDLLTKSDLMLQPPNEGAWTPTLEALLRLIVLPQALTSSQAESVAASNAAVAGGATEATSEEVQVIDLEETGYQATFSRLASSERGDVDPVGRVEDVRGYLGKGMGEVAQRYPGKILPLIQAVPEAFGTPFLGFLTSSGINID